MRVAGPILKPGLPGLPRTPGRPKRERHKVGDMRVKAPFLIETRKWPLRKQFRVLDAGYGVSSLVVLRFKGKLKTRWVWAQGRTR
jgi:hypothetical protein